MARIVKMCDMSADIAAKVFKALNGNKIALSMLGCMKVIVTDVEPKDLVYPEGWYYAKGTFRNKHMSTTGMYHTIDMIKSNGEFWDDIAKYCTLDM